jgi:uncharacterized glyoxalase superfamily protein PhnB
MSVQTIPQGYTSLTPFLCIDGASAAIDFYVSVFGAKLVDRMDGQDGTVAHAELDFGTGRIQLGDPNEGYQIAAPDPTGPATHSMGFYCEDDRFASVLDPFGTRWTVMTRVEEFSPEERDRRLAQWAEENA